MNTSDLERALHARAEQAGPPPVDLLGRIADLRRARRRRRTAVLAAAAAVVLVAVAVPTTLALTDERSGSTAGPVEVPVLGVATRGSLADDTALVDAVAELPWAAPALAEPVDEPAAGSRHVELLDDVDGTRYALVTGLVRGDRYAAWFTAPVGSDASGFALAGYPKYVLDTEPLAFSDTTVASPAVLVVAAPGDDVDFSDRAVLTAAGTVDRSYSPGDSLGDGVAALPTSEERVAGVSVRVSRDSVTVFRSRPDTVGGSRPAPTVDMSTVAYPRGTVDAVTQQQVAATFEEITRSLQLPLDHLRPTVLWAGAVPGPENRETTALVVGVTAPSGGSIVSAAVFTNVGDGQYGVTIGGWEAYDSSHPLLEQAQLFRSTVTDGSASGQPVSALLLLDPVDGVGTPQPPVDGTELAPGVHLLTDDVTTVAYVDGTGALLTEARLMDSAYFDRYDYGTGPA